MMPEVIQVAAAKEHRCPRCRADVLGVGFIATDPMLQCYQPSSQGFVKGGSVRKGEPELRCILCSTKLPWTLDGMLAVGLAAAKPVQPIKSEVAA